MAWPIVESFSLGMLDIYFSEISSHTVRCWSIPTCAMSAESQTLWLSATKNQGNSQYHMQICINMCVPLLNQLWWAY